MFCPLIESALWQVGRQDNAHVSKGEGIVTTRPCDGNKSWGVDDSVVDPTRGELTLFRPFEVPIKTFRSLWDVTVGR